MRIQTKSRSSRFKYVLCDIGLGPIDLKVTVGSWFDIRIL